MRFKVTYFTPYCSEEEIRYFIANSRKEAETMAQDDYYNYLTDWASYYIGIPDNDCALDVPDDEFDSFAEECGFEVEEVDGDLAEFEENEFMEHEDWEDITFLNIF